MANSGMAQSMPKQGTMGNDPLEKMERATGAATKEPLEKVRDAGAQAVGKAREAVGCVGEMASEAACAVSKTADDLAAAAGHRVTAAADQLRHNAPHDGLAGRASKVFADTLEGSGHYLEEAKLSGVTHDLAEVIKTHPIPTMLICLGLGYCVGRAMRD